VGYAFDDNQPLTATAGSKTTTYLYGLEPIGQLTDSWAYDLTDGTNTPRQLVDAQGAVTFSARYTPWGDTLESSGTGNISIGYLGGLMDTATGLLYVGNGNYYDPSTGRFLNRNAKPNQTNPYVPWGGEPGAAPMAPLALLSLFYSRKKKRGTLDTVIILLVLGVSLSLGLTACGPSTSAPKTLPTAVVVIIHATSTVTGTGTVSVTANGTPVATGTPVIGLTPDVCTNITITFIATPNSNGDKTIYGVDNRRKEFLTDILYESKNLGLPPGFQPGILVAIALAESAAQNNWENVIWNGFGIFQVETGTGPCKSLAGTYQDTHEGYDQNVKDAICQLNLDYAYVQQGIPQVNYHDAFKNALMQNTPSYSDWKIVLTVLHYNGGGDPINLYQNRLGTEYYLSQVADKIPDVANVTSDFGCQFQINNSNLQQELYVGQSEVLYQVKNYVPAQ
jgi:RHS repeat-associated protein